MFPLLSGNNSILHMNSLHHGGKEVSNWLGRRDCKVEEEEEPYSAGLIY